MKFFTISHENFQIISTAYENYAFGAYLNKEPIIIKKKH